MPYFYQHIHTPLGVMTAVVTDEALIGLNFTDSKDYQTAMRHYKEQERLIHISNHPIINQIALELEAYFHGHLHHFKTPVSHTIGTPFQQQVWQALRQLPFGTTVTYSHIAQMIERPKSVRAVASAIGQNPLSIIVPCHRVLRKDGHLGGFNSGLNRKKYLLTLEGDHNGTQTF